MSTKQAEKFEKALTKLVSDEVARRVAEGVFNLKARAEAMQKERDQARKEARIAEEELEPAKKELANVRCQIKDLEDLRAKERVTTTALQRQLVELEKELKKLRS